MIKFFATPYVIFELVAAYFFIHAYGFLNLVLEVIATGALGLFLMFRVGFFQLTTNIVFFKPADIFSGVGMAIGGFFLFLPGIISDIFGAAIAVVAFFANLDGKNGAQQAKFSYRTSEPKNEGEIIDVEIIEEKTKVRYERD